MNKTCPLCFGTIRPEDKYCPKCGPKPSRVYKRENERADAASRRSLHSASYKRNRQVVIERSNGLCAYCGAVIAERTKNGWRCAQGAAIHHIVKRTLGGTDDVSNLVFVCRRCHYKLDHPK